MAIPIHFHAVFVPDYRFFRVSMVFPKKQPGPKEEVIAQDGQYRVQLDLSKPNVVQIMEPADFLLWARSPGPIVIDGVTVILSQDEFGISEAQVKAYFHEVADAYESYASKQNN